MAGKAKFAERMASHLNQPIEAACPIAQQGGTTTQVAFGVGGIAGAVVAGMATNKKSDVAVGQFAWLGLGPNGLVITKSGMTGKPKGDPVAQVAFNEIVRGSVTEGKLTLKVELDLVDGRHVAFEAKRHGANKPSVEVLELLRHRAGLS